MESVHSAEVTINARIVSGQSSGYTAINSHEAEILQLADLLTGAVCYANRSLSTNAAKCALVERMRRRSGYELARTTLIRESKVNLFRWNAA